MFCLHPGSVSAGIKLLLGLLGLSYSIFQRHVSFPQGYMQHLVVHLLYLSYLHEGHRLAFPLKPDVRSLVVRLLLVGTPLDVAGLVILVGVYTINGVKQRRSRAYRHGESSVAAFPVGVHLDAPSSVVVVVVVVVVGAAVVVVVVGAAVVVVVVGAAVVVVVVVGGIVVVVVVVVVGELAPQVDKLP